MYICKNCGQTYPTAANFCGKCGGPVVESVEPTSAYTPNVEPTAPYAYTATPVAEAPKSKAPGIIGMIFGVLATIFSFVSIIIASGFIESAENFRDRYYYYSYYYYSLSDRLDMVRAEAIGAFIGLSIFIIPFIIVGLIMSFKNSGIKAMSIVGRITSFIGLALWIVSLFMTLSI